MDKTVIILKQNKDSGKTSTLNYLIDLFKTIATAPCLDAPSFPNVEDKAVIIPMEGGRIGIITLGDPGYEEQFQIWLDFCHNNKCDIIVVATRTKETVDGNDTPYKLIWNFIYKESYQAFETSPYVTYEHVGHMDKERLNKLCAQSLFSTIKTLIIKSL